MVVRMSDTRKSWVDSLPCNYAVAVIASINSELVTYPLDVIKTRLQIQGELAAAKEGISTLPHRGIVQTASGIVTEEGILKLWQGLSPAIYRNVIYSGVRIITYQTIREYILKPEPDGSYSLWKASLTGSLSGVIAQFLANPVDLVKIQMQMEGKRRLLGKPPRAINASQVFRDLYRAGGLGALWKGAVPNMWRAFMVNIGDLSAYDYSKRIFLQHTRLKDNYITHILSSIVAGMVGALLATPADVIKARYMNQPLDVLGRGILYRNPADCLLQSVRNEGFFALYKGFFPMWFRLAPWALIFWVSYEQIKLLLNGNTF